MKEKVCFNNSKSFWFLIYLNFNSIQFQLVDHLTQMKSLKDRQELKSSLIATQDTAVIQILLDIFIEIKKVKNFNQVSL
jgi:hypothetical protein